MESSIKNKIIKTLMENPQGLTIIDISKIVGASRFTISKYVYWLSAEKTILQKHIGPAKICCLRPDLDYVEMDDVDEKDVSAAKEVVFV